MCLFYNINSEHHNLLQLEVFGLKKNLLSWWTLVTGDTVWKAILVQHHETELGCTCFFFHIAFNAKVSSRHFKQVRAHWCGEARPYTRTWHLTSLSLSGSIRPSEEQVGCRSQSPGSAPDPSHHCPSTLHLSGSRDGGDPGWRSGFCW